MKFATDSKDSLFFSSISNQNEVNHHIIVCITCAHNIVAIDNITN